MELTKVPDVGNEEAEALARAGVETVEDLRHANPATLADAAGLDAERVRVLVAAAREVRVLTDVPGMTPSAARRLEEAGVADPEALRDAHVDTLAAGTGLDMGFLLSLRDAADAADLKVLLQGADGEARVRLRGAWHEDVPILTARSPEAVDAVLEEASGDVVLLVEGAEAAVVRVGDDTFESVPIYKSRPVTRTDGTADTEEVRVRVQLIREKRLGDDAVEPAAADAGAPTDVSSGRGGRLAGRFFGRRKGP